MKQTSQVLPFGYGSTDVDDEIITYYNAIFVRDFGPWKAGHETNIQFHWNKGVMRDYDTTTGESEHTIRVHYQPRPT